MRATLKPKTNSERHQKVFVAMSGGVDSSTAAALLKERGFDVCGVHIKMWSDPEIPCATKEDRHDAMRVAAKLNIPFETWDFTQDYKREVVEYMICEYAAGRTPNPDVMCNRRIKFGVFLDRALAHDADYIATGHYVRLRRSHQPPATSNHLLEAGSWKLEAARDRAKDQSYFLWTLTQERLKHCLFPIGEYTKPEVRQMARKFRLPTAEKPDSQGICFIGEINMRDFLKRHILMRPGLIKLTSGKVIGEHEGLSFYTIGQRRGLGIGGGIPYYVAQKDFAQNILTVAEGPYDERLFSSELATGSVNWISGKAPILPFMCEARIRYRQPLQKAIIESRITKHEARRDEAVSVIRDSKFVIRFAEAQRAVTSGQSVVFYTGEKMVGGGVII